MLVTVNYRTGIFGFLAAKELSALEGNGGSSGLFGIHDQTMALKWVQQNIAAFGGDPVREAQLWTARRRGGGERAASPTGSHSGAVTKNGQQRGAGTTDSQARTERQAKG